MRHRHLAREVVIDDAAEEDGITTTRIWGLEGLGPLDLDSGPLDLDSGPPDSVAPMAAALVYLEVATTLAVSEYLTGAYCRACSLKMAATT